MLQLLQPIWLAAMAGIAIPVIVHLWNLRRGKILKIGSVALLTGASRRLAWSRRITQWWLLALRCLLLASLAFLLAGPYWVKRGVGGKGWVLAEASAGGERYGGVIDSLMKAGYERHMLGDSENYWAGFRAADKMAPAGLPFFVFTSGLESRFSGKRPTTGRDVHWYTYAPADSVSRWIQSAWYYSADSIEVVEGVSSGTGTHFEHRRISAGTRAYGDIKADTAVLRFRIYADGVYRADARYVRAAIKALGRETGKRVEEGDGGWLFWLSAKPVAGASGYAHIWKYAAGKEVAADTWMRDVRVMKEIVGEPGSGTPVWIDGYGRGVLVREGKVYTFYSRLDVNWGDLVWSRRWPVLLAGLMVDDPVNAARDRRMLDPRQVGPVKAGMAGSGAVVGNMQGTDWRPGIWVIVFLLFFLERVIAFKNGTGKA